MLRIYLLQNNTARIKKSLMRYHRIRNEHYITNGKSTIRVGPVLVMPSPTSKGRTVKVFEVLQTIRENPANTLPRGAMIALSFPNEHLGKSEYTWGKIEESQIPFEITDRAVNIEAVNRKAAKIRKQTPPQPPFLSSN
jgi:hypothetical protein